MTQTIIYPTNDGGVAVITPAPNCAMTIEEIAVKDVPAGVPFKIVSAETIPEDRIFRAAWEADFTDPDGYGIGAEAWFAQRAAQENA